MSKWIVKDWAGNELHFYGESDSFEEAWGKIYEQFPEEESFEDFHVEEID